MVAKLPRQARRRPAELRPHGADRQRRRRLPRPAVRAVQPRPRRPAALLHRAVRRRRRPSSAAATCCASWRTSSPRTTRPSRSRATAWPRSSRWRLLRAKAAFDISKDWPKAAGPLRRHRVRPRLLPGPASWSRRACRSSRSARTTTTATPTTSSATRRTCSVLDPAWSALLHDLQERGLLQDTLVVWMGEVGRTPYINNRAGRDHYIRAWTIVLAGGGIKGGAGLRRDRRRRQGREGQPGVARATCSPRSTRRWASTRASSTTSAPGRSGRRRKGRSRSASCSREEKGRRGDGGGEGIEFSPPLPFSPSPILDGVWSCLTSRNSSPPGRCRGRTTG